MPDASVDVNLGRGRASLVVSGLPVLDFGDIVNALFPDPARPPVPASASFEVRWEGVIERTSIVNNDQGFVGQFVRTNAHMEWSAIVGDFSFESAPASTSSSVFAEIGQERNGSFFPFA